MPIADHGQPRSHQCIILFQVLTYSGCRGCATRSEPCNPVVCTHTSLYSIEVPLKISAFMQFTTRAHTLTPQPGDLQQVKPRMHAYDAERSPDNVDHEQTHIVHHLQVLGVAHIKALLCQKQHIQGFLIFLLKQWQAHAGYCCLKSIETMGASATFLNSRQ